MDKKRSKKVIKQKSNVNFVIPLAIILATVISVVTFARVEPATNIIIDIEVPFDHSTWDKNFSVVMHQSYVDNEDKPISEINPSFSIPLPSDVDFNSSYTEIRVIGFESVNGLIPEGEGWLGRTEGNTLIFNSSEVFDNSEETKIFTFLSDEWSDFTVDSISVNYTKDLQGLYYEMEFYCFNYTTNETEICWNADYMSERVRVNVSLAGFEIDTINHVLKPNYQNPYIKIRIPLNFTVAYVYYAARYEGDAMGEVAYQTISENGETYLLITEIMFYKTSFTLYMPFRRIEEESV